MIDNSQLQRIGDLLLEGFGVEDVAVKLKIDTRDVRTVMKMMRGLGKFKPGQRVPQ